VLRRYSSVRLKRVDSINSSTHPLKKLKIRVNLHHGKIEEAVVRAVVQHEDGLKLQVDFGHEQTALIDPRQIVED
jgi:hypothetical protein